MGSPELATKARKAEETLESPVTILAEREADSEHISITFRNEGKGMCVQSQIRALVSGFPGKHATDRQLLMLQAYIDESGRGQGDLLVLAGYIAPSEAWAEKFVPEWDRLLKLGPPKHRNIDAFKMKDMLDQPEQSSWFYRVIEESVVAEVSCVLSLSELYAAYREFPWPFRFADNSLFTNPYYMGFQAIMTLMAQFQKQLCLDEPIDFIFDETTEKANCMIAWDGMKQFGSVKVREMLGDAPIFRPDTKVLPLQAAVCLRIGLENGAIRAS